MLQDNGPAMKLLVPLLWMMTGFVSWYLSIYLFSYILSPILIDVVRKINAINQSIVMKIIANMIFAKAADFTLGFTLALFLSFFTGSTKIRLLLFISGATAISLYDYIFGTAIVGNNIPISGIHLIIVYNSNFIVRR